MADTRRLPGPVSDIWDWQRLGACRGMDSGEFFHPEGERGQARANREKRAKEICARCPVLETCRRHALEVHEPYGVWGGLSEHERDALLRGRDRTLREPGEASARPRTREGAGGPSGHPPLRRRT